MSRWKSCSAASFSWPPMVLPVMTMAGNTARGQWRRNADGTFALVVVDNQTAPNIPTGGVMEALA